MTSAAARPLPRLAAACDAGTLLLALLALGLALVGPYRTTIGDTGVTLAWTHAAFAALAIAILRHLAWWSPSLADTLRAWTASVARRPALADAMLAFWLTRPAVLLVGVLAVATIGLPADAPEYTTGRQGVSGLPARYDANWYAGIAGGGYEWEHQFRSQQNLAFFPAYPLLIRAVGTVTGAFRAGLPPPRLLVRLTWCGLFVSLVAFFWAAWYFARLAHDVLDDDRARMASLLLASYPFALFFSAPYSEPLFLLGALGAWWHFRRGELLPAAGWGLLAGLARSPGCFLSVPLGLIAIGVRDASSRDGATPAQSLPVRLAVAAMPGIGMLLFTIYLYRETGVWFAWARMHEAWGRVMGASAPVSLSSALSSTSLLETITDRPHQALNALAFVFALALVAAVWRRIGPAWAVYVLLSVLLPFSAGGLLSMGRFSSTLFPVFLALAAILPSRTAPAVLVPFALLQGLLAALFYTWRNIY